MMMSMDYLIQKYNLQFDGIIHIGANLGQELEFYRSIGIKKLILVEPIPYIFNELKEYTNWFNDIDISCYNIALGNDEKNVEMYISDNQAQSSSILEPKIHLSIHPEVKFFENKITVPMKKLDNLEFNRSHYNTMILDVQGYELEVFKGSIDTLNSIDYIYAEVNKDYVYSNNGLVTELDEFLNQYNFTRVETYWVGDLPWGEALYIKSKNVF